MTQQDFKLIWLSQKIWGMTQHIWLIQKMRVGGGGGRGGRGGGMAQQ